MRNRRNVSRQLALFVLAMLCIVGVAFVTPRTVQAGTLVGVTNLHQTDAGSSYFKVEWDKDVNAGGYEFQYSTDGSNWSVSSYTQYLSKSISGLNSGRSYYVRMRSFDYYNSWTYSPSSGAVYSDWSSAFEVVTAPENISNLVQTKGGSSSITVSWDKASGATAYQVYYVLGGSEFLSGETTKTTYKIKNLEPDKYYEIRVYAVRESASGYEAKSGYASHNCYTTAGKVKKLELDKWDTDDNTVRVTWNDNEDTNTGYEVNVTNLSGKKIKNFAVTTSYAEFSIDSIKNKGCIVKVRAYRDIDGVEIYGKWSSSKVIVAQPSLVLEKKSNTSIRLSWKKISGATSYTVYRSTSSYTGFKKIKTTKSTSLTNSKLNSGTTYYYYVVANGVKVKGKSAKSTKATYREIAYINSWGRNAYTYEKVN
jgi:hypothetical protein